jgi:hypothetical protein
MKRLLLAALTSALAFSSAAQTGRIAHFSHGGSTMALLSKEEGIDNFGTPYLHRADEWKKDSFVCVNDSLVEHRGLVRTYNNSNKPSGPWKRRVDVYIGRGNEIIQVAFPKAVLVKPRKKKQRSSKPAGNSYALPVRPFQYSLWRGMGGLAGLGALGAVGWLLGKKRAA